MQRRLALLLAVFALCVTALETGLRVFDRFPPPPQTPTPRFPDLYAAVPELGYTLRPSLRTTYRYPIGSATTLSLVSNSDGFRSDREFDEPDPRPRIWVLGDSMTLGEGVEVADRYSNVIERLEPGWRLDNLGMGGWGLDLMVRAYEKISSRLRPDLVLLGFYTDDFRRLGPYYAGQGYPVPKFVLQDGRLTSVPFPGPLPAWRRLRLVQAVEQGRERLGRNRFELNGALLERLHAGVGDGRLAIVFIPGRGVSAEDQERQRFLETWCQAHATPLLDLTEPLRTAGIEATYLPDNPHWNARGHEIAARAIRQFLLDRRLVRAEPAN